MGCFYNFQKTAHRKQSHNGRKVWDRCYDIKNIFAEKFGAFLLKLLLVFAIFDHNMGFWEKRQFFEEKLAKNCDHNTDPSSPFSCASYYRRRPRRRQSRRTWRRALTWPSWTTSWTPPRSCRPWPSLDRRTPESFFVNSIRNKNVAREPILRLWNWQLQRQRWM
jgi:hypothetical protein